MFEHSSFSSIKARKRELVKELEAHRREIERFDRAELGGTPIRIEEYYDSSRSIDEIYDDLHCKLQKIKDNLNEIRLLGDEFEVREGGEDKIIEITPDGKLNICSIQYLRTPQVPDNMSRYSYYRIGESKKRPNAADNPNQPQFVARYVLNDPKKPQHSIHDLMRLRAANPMEYSGVYGGERACVLEWRDGQVTKLVVQREYQEFEEVVGHMLNRYNRSCLTQVARLRELWALKNQPFDPSNAEHEAQLMQLWDVVFPEQPIDARVSSQWSRLGFQGRDPATDFRGMGLLGLHNLLYYAQHYTAEVRSVLAQSREYPFASVGINLTSVLLVDYLGVTADKMKHASASSAWQSPMMRFLATANVPNGFEEVYCVLFRVLDATWVEMNAGYMDFPLVLARVKQQFSTLLSRFPVSIEQLRTWVGISATWNAAEDTVATTPALPPTSEPGADDAAASSATSSPPQLVAEDSQRQETAEAMLNDTASSSSSTSTTTSSTTTTESSLETYLQ